MNSNRCWKRRLKRKRSRDTEGRHCRNSEMAVTARGVAKAAEILAGQFTLVATNVPYLGRRKQDDVLKDYCEHIHPRAKSDLATCFVERCLDLCENGGSSGVVAPQNWLFLGSYKSLRESLLRRRTWNIVVQLGEHAFESSQAAGAFVAMVLMSETLPIAEKRFAGAEASTEQSPASKAETILLQTPTVVAQAPQLLNPDAVVTFEEPSVLPILETIADAPNGSHGGDSPRHRRVFGSLERSAITGDFFKARSKKSSHMGEGNFFSHGSTMERNTGRIKTPTSKANTSQGNLVSL